MIPIYVGYDKREAVGYSVFCHSVLERTDEEVSFTPVRGVKRQGSSTSFDLSRFCVARMQNFKGWAIWAECDMLMRSDIAELWALRDDKCDVMVAKHKYTTKHQIKFLNQPNEDYPRKNWTSLMLINCAFWKHLSLSKAQDSQLHRLEFLEDEQIGELPLEWNWLVGEYAHNPAAKLAHFTIGLPCWPQYEKCDYAEEWHEERSRMNRFAA